MKTKAKPKFYWSVRNFYIGLVKFGVGNIGEKG